MFPEEHDIDHAVTDLARLLPDSLKPLARVAYDYRWSWAADGFALFKDMDAERWERCGHNPRRLLTEIHQPELMRAGNDPVLVGRAQRLADELIQDRARPSFSGFATHERPVAFFCSDFGVHGSLPIYSGGLGVLAGDILKEASDLALPMVGIGLMYRTGYFLQRIDVTGCQHEYWLDADPERLPCVKVTGADGRPIAVNIPINNEGVAAHIWRVDGSRVPLYLLDTDLPGNSPVGRWVTSRLYESNRSIRLAQYAVLGVGGVRALRALGLTPAVYHWNEGHPALGAFELLAQIKAANPTDASAAEAWQQVRDQVVFTTHTPVPAGNETYQRHEVLQMLWRVADLCGDREQFLALGRIHPQDPDQPVGMSALALRASRHANAVSRRHGEVARAMWQPLFSAHAVNDVPITHVTNGVHVPTWLSGPMRRLLDQYLGNGWLHPADQTATWAPVADIPAQQLWAARCVKPAAHWWTW